MGAAYTSAMPVLTSLRNTLAAVPGVVTCKIGIEANMTPADYPMVRIVPSVTRPSALLDVIRSHECLIYFGQPVHEFEAGLEALYTGIFALEVALINALPLSGEWVARWQETITDEDRVDGYKLMALRVVVDG